MKWTLVGLLVLGVVAAACAVVLVVSLRADKSIVSAVQAAAIKQAAPAEVDVLVALTAIPAMTVIDAKSVTRKRVAKKLAPKDYYADPVQVSGNVLALPMVEGQAFTPSCFVTEGSGKHLAAELPEGMRAVSVSLPDHSRLSGILYPGSIVDVLVSLKVPSAGGGRGEVVSTTLLESVQVLGIKSRTVVNAAEEKGKAGSNRVSSRSQMVTLMLNSRQAQMLRLAAEHGSVSLAMRSPLDEAPIDKRGVLLSELSPEYFRRLAELARLKSAADEEPAAEPEVERPVKWEVLILRGGKRDTQAVAMPPSEVGRVVSQQRGRFGDNE